MKNETAVDLKGYAMMLLSTPQVGEVPHNLGSSLSYHCTRDNKCISLSLTHLRKMLFD